MRLPAIAVLLALLLVGCGSDDDGASKAAAFTVGGVAPSGGELAWPAPPSEKVADLAKAAGLELETKESLIHHVHAHLDVFIDGEHRLVPAGVGIIISDPAVHTGTFEGQPTYGGIAGCDTPCISPLHTHDVTGTLHTESATEENNTLGQFFTEWDVELTDTCVATYCKPDTPIRLFVDGKEKPLASAADLELSNEREIAIVIGKPPARVPAEGDFSNA